MLNFTEVFKLQVNITASEQCVNTILTVLHGVPCKCTSQIEALISPPGQPPGHLNFWKTFVQIPPSLGRKAVQMPPPLGILPDYRFNFSVVSIMLLKLCM